MELIGRPPRDAPVLFVDDLDAPELTSRDRHHIERVLRLPAGASITIADGRGGWRTAALGAVLEDLGPRRREPDTPALTVGFALLKGDRTELVVQKLTEIGITRIVLLVTERAVVRWNPDTSARKLERLRTVAQEAATQSRRATLPIINPPTDMATIDSHEGTALAEPEGGRLGRHITTVLVGPEGGWTSTELTAVSQHVKLAPTILRAETAAIAAGVLLVASHNSATD